MWILYALYPNNAYRSVHGKLALVITRRTMIGPYNRGYPSQLLTGCDTALSDTIAIDPWKHEQCKLMHLHATEESHIAQNDHIAEENSDRARRSGASGGHCDLGRCESLIAPGRDGGAVSHDPWMQSSYDTGRGDRVSHCGYSTRVVYDHLWVEEAAVTRHSNEYWKTWKVSTVQRLESGSDPCQSQCAT